MKVFFEPKTILVARPQIVWSGVGELLDEFGIFQARSRTDCVDGWNRNFYDKDGESLPELMGRLCYASFGKNQGRVGAADYIGHILEQGHGSVLEHANWSFVVCRAGRGYTHQMVRHRAGFAYSQESTHFIKYGDGTDGTVEGRACLAGLEPNSLEASIAQRGMADALKAYSVLWETVNDDLGDVSPGTRSKRKKIVSGTARQVLPNGLESKLGFTGNARALRHFCEMRGNPANTLEVRTVAAQVATIMCAEAPALFQDCEVRTDDDGHKTVTFRHHKV